MQDAINTWQDVQREVLGRIQNRVWKPGDIIPNEVDLAKEFGCARATVNRALQAVADSGLLDRRRKAGTRVAVNPVRKATLEIPIIRQEIEQRGQHYQYVLIEQQVTDPQADMQAMMKLSDGQQLLHLKALHLADGLPHVYEDRWINISTVPEIVAVDWQQNNANEWLVAHAPFSDGDIAFSAGAAGAVEAEILNVPLNTAVFIIERSTWMMQQSITRVRLTYAPGHRLHTTI